MSKKISVTQKGTPEKPKLVFSKPHIAASSVLGIGVFNALEPGASATAYVDTGSTGLIIKAIGESEAALTALLTQQAAAVPKTKAKPTVRKRDRPVRRRIPLSDEPLAFHNPYNFVPFVPRPTEAPQPCDQGLLDGAPPGHHKWVTDRWTGTIDVEMTVVTPLILIDPESALSEGKHKSYDILRHGKTPLVPSSAIKGALRSAFECITNSRLPRFDTHGLPLGFRHPARSALGTMPVRVTSIDKNLIEFEVLDHHANEQGHGAVQPAAWLPSYDAGRNTDARRASAAAVLLEGESEAEHGTSVHVRCELMRHTRGDFKFWRVRQMVSPSNALPPAPAYMSLSNAESLGRFIVSDGWVYRTNQNVRNKHDERVFFKGTKTAKATDPTRVADDWTALIKDYQRQHKHGEIHGRTSRGKDAPPTAYLGGNPGQTAWSAHVFRDEWQELRPGSLCYAKLDANGDVDRLFPVSISRDVYDRAPDALVPTSLQPAEVPEQFSPADRVFGWVNSSRKTRPVGAYRGHVRVSPVAPSPGEALNEMTGQFRGHGLPLSILGAPKGQQYRFYVGDRNGRAPARAAATRFDSSYSSPNTRLRGRKVYPHHRLATLIPNYWSANASPKLSFQGKTYSPEWRRVGSERDSQNRSVRGWIRPNSKFVFQVHVNNLHQVELGALLWLLDAQAGQHLRIGGGKPLGFGSVQLRVVRNGVRQGSHYQRRYETFQPQTGEAAQSTDELRNAFIDSTTRLYPDGALHLDAYQRAAAGFEDDLPIHYPRESAQPDAKGENFRWFQANDDEKHQYVLQDLVNDSGLPILSKGTRR